MKLYIVFACWPLVYLMLYIFHAVVYYTDFIINPPTTALFYNLKIVKYFTILKLQNSAAVG
jgi:hypothetical protein